MENQACHFRSDEKLVMSVSYLFTAANAPTQMAIANTKTCFFIDDDDDDRDFFCTAMKAIETEMECVFSKNGHEAIEKLTGNPDFTPNFIFMDMNMPLMNGKECLEIITEIERLKHTKVYIYSSSGNPKLVDELLSLGATDFLIKPSTMTDLKQMLKDVLT